MRYKKSIIWGIISVLNFWFFFDVLPIQLALDSTVFWTLLLAAISAGSLTALAVNLMADLGKEESTRAGYFSLFAIFIGVFLIPILFIYVIYERKDDLLNKESVFTYGRVSDGRISNSSRHDNSYLKIVFGTKDGQYLTEDYSISAKGADNYAIDQEVPLIYCSSYPRIFKILSNESDVEKYSGKKVRDIKLTELLKLFELKTERDKCDFLNSILDKWHIEPNNSYTEDIFTNYVRNTAIKVLNKKNVIYIHNGSEKNLFTKELDSLGFEKLKFDNEEFYTNKKFVVVIGNEMEKVLDMQSPRPLGMFTLVTIRKLN